MQMHNYSKPSYKQWHTTNAICLFSFEKFETFTCLFTKFKKIVVILSTTAYNELEVSNLLTAVDMCQCLYSNLTLQAGNTIAGYE